MAETVNPFALIQQGVENTNQLFASMQRSILQTRQQQLQEQSQIFNQGIALKGLELREKEMNLNAQVTMAKLGMANQEMAMQAALTAQRIETEKAHAGLYNAQAWKAQQLQTVAPYYNVPLNGTADDIIQGAYGMQTQASMTSDPVLDGVLNEVVSTPPTAPAYQDRSVPAALGSTSLGIGSAQAFQRGIIRGLEPQGDGDLFADTPEAASGASSVPQSTSKWDRFEGALDILKQQAMLMPGWTNQQRQAQITRLEQTKLDKAQNEFSTDPKAQQILRNLSEATDYVKQLAANGDRQGVLDAQRSFRDQYGYDNPNYQQAARDGFNEFRRIQQEEKVQKQYENLLQLQMKAAEAGRPTEALDRQILQLEQTMGLSGSMGTDRSQADAIMDAASGANAATYSPYYSPATTYP